MTSVYYRSSLLFRFVGWFTLTPDEYDPEAELEAGTVQTDGAASSSLLAIDPNLVQGGSATGGSSSKKWPWSSILCASNNL
jgi:hypothetical protein